MTPLLTYLIEADYDSLTFGADDDDFTPEKAEEMAKKIWGLGAMRLAELARYIKPSSDGAFYVPHSSKQYGSEMHDQANYDYITKKFPWLHTSNTIPCLDPEEAEKTAGDLERYVAKIPQEEWASFLEDMENIRRYPVFDEDLLSEMERKEEQRWVDEDGVPTLRKALLDEAQDSFTAFVASWAVTSNFFWDLCQSSSEYPQVEGDSAWMDVDKLVEDGEVLADALASVEPEKMERLKALWTKIKRRVYTRYGLDDKLDAALRKHMPDDDEVQGAFAALTEESLYRFFLLLVPDSAYKVPGRLRWVPLKSYAHHPSTMRWVCTESNNSYSIGDHEWQHSFDSSLERLMQDGTAYELLRTFPKRDIPLDHPELPLGEAKQKQIYRHKPGDTCWFEYHCYEGDDSCDAKLWHHSHQQCKVLKMVEAGDGVTEMERGYNGYSAVFKVRFADGFVWDTFEDELLDDRSEFERPDPPLPPEQRPDKGEKPLYGPGHDPHPRKSKRKPKMEAAGDPDDPQHYIDQAGWREFKFRFDYGANELGQQFTFKVPRHLLLGFAGDLLIDKVINYVKLRALIPKDDWTWLVDVSECNPVQEGVDDPEANLTRHISDMPFSAIFARYGFEEVKPLVWKREQESWLITVKETKRKDGTTAYFLLDSYLWHFNRWSHVVWNKKWYAEHATFDRVLKDIERESEGTLIVGQTMDDPVRESIDDPDAELDPESYVKSGGYLRSAPVYVDQFIEIIEPRDPDTLATLRGIHPSMVVSAHRTGFAHQQHFVVFNRKTRRTIGSWEEEDGRLVPTYGSLPIESFLKQYLSAKAQPADQAIAKAMKRGFIKIFRDWLKSNREERSWGNISRDLGLLLQFGGPTELKRATREDPGEMDQFKMAIGINMARGGNLKEAAVWLGHSAKEMTKDGVWLKYPDFVYLSDLFKNEDAAKQAFEGETYDWFSYLWERGNQPKVEDCVGWLSSRAVKHLRDILINRSVWFPEAGPDGQGAYLPLTRKLLDEYDDKNILSWVSEPSDEDKESGVFDDIRAAIVEGGVRLLEMVGRDLVEARYRSRALDKFDVKDTDFNKTWKWVDHPTKKGSDMLAIFTPWSTIFEAYEEMTSQEQDYQNNLEDMMTDRHKRSIETQESDFWTDWPSKTDTGADYYRDECSMPLLELEMTQEQVDPRQTELGLGEGVDDPRTDLADWLTKPPHSVVVDLTEIVESLTQGHASNIEMHLRKSRYDHFLFIIEFDMGSRRLGLRVQPRFTYDEHSKMARTLQSHVVNALAQVGYVVETGAQRMWKTEHAQHASVGYEWQVKKGNFQ
jgi:hypothetical protein